MAGAAGAVGGDVQSVAAVGEALAAHGRRYLDRVYTPAEQAAADGDAGLLASAYAVKEAVLKLLGDPSGIALPDIEVTGLDGGSIGVRMHDAAAERARAARPGAIHASVSLAGGLAIAVVVTEPCTSLR